MWVNNQVLVKLRPSSSRNLTGGLRIITEGPVVVVCAARKTIVVIDWGWGPMWERHMPVAVQHADLWPGRLMHPS